ncbi:MAG: polyhydroxyalkanoic acid system family protein [Sphingomonadales bacterium]|nr:polyhydroxyalkanoic acid system family protein [Sphingomonadales bacterium]MBD3772002.1 polyhydroxyalkanoic acid system family protein [Paracoccaceae bacterium]MBD3813933.1 polyhydroxyalkanoic acid system family protein [Betaproteobacteria bacterium]
MRVAIPHAIDRDEAKRRFEERIHEVVDHIPGGNATIATSWPDTYLMDMVLHVLGQEIHGHLDIQPAEVIIVFDLPPGLGFVERMVSGMIRDKGTKLLA